MTILHRSNRSQMGASLPEALITMTILMMVLAAVLAGHLYGFKLYALNRSKLQSTQAARELASDLLSEVYQAVNIYVASNFSMPFPAIAGTNANLRQGNALQIWPDASNYVCYYYDPADARLKRRRSGSTNVATIGESIKAPGTNPMFSMQDYRGNILSNEVGNCSICIRVDFETTNYPSGQKMDYYKFETKIARRSLFVP
jgi:type II secretory pathway pseudopilin PulG